MFFGAHRSADEEDLAAATTARDEAGERFLSLDTELAIIEGRAAAAQSMGVNAPAGYDQHLARVRACAQERVQEWVTLSDRHQAALSATEPQTLAVREASADYRQVATRLNEVLQSLQDFNDRYRSHHEQVAAAAAGIEQGRTEALHQMQQALAAVSALAPELRRSPAIADALSALDAAASAMTSAPAPAMAVAIRSAGAAAGAVHVAVETTASLAANVPTKIVTTRTRLEAITTRAQKVPETLSQLRRQYSAACSTGLEHAEASADEALTRAAQQLLEAERHAVAGDWPTSASQLETARASLNDATVVVDAVLNRLRELDAVKANPAALAEQTRFVVRDAQRLVTSIGVQRLVAEVRLLDSLVLRLERAAEGLTGVHPDYWAYRCEMHLIEATAREAIARSRAVASRR